jgi:ATP-binding cassette subfamily B protein
VHHTLPVDELSAPGNAPVPLSPELVAALAEPPSQPGRVLLGLLRADGLLAPTVLLAALVLSAAGVVIEGLLLRGLIDFGRDLGLVGQRLGAMGLLLVFTAALLLLELSITSGVLRAGRQLEVRLRLAFLEKIPRLGDRYFHSRLTSDMAERSHSLHRIRLLPELGGQFLLVSSELVLTTAGIAWLDPASTPLALLAAVLAIGLPLAAQPLLAERDFRVRTHIGALSRFSLDALLGLVAIRTHGAALTLRSAQAQLLGEWAQASLALLRTVVTVEGVQLCTGFGLTAWLLFAYYGRGGEASVVLLLIYWALHLPVLGQEVALLARQYPSHRNVTLRLLEPLGALTAMENGEERMENATWRGGNGDHKNREGLRRGVDIAMQGVQVRVGGHTVLAGIDVSIAPGTHVAIVGPSGAGKSSLVGTLLGWYRPATGEIRVDGVPLESQRLAELRRQTAWVDPAVQLWNRSLLDNVYYGNAGDLSCTVGQAVAQADLRGVLERLPDGLQTRLGEGGALVSGGEGQRVRLARAMLRPEVRLVILDEPCRGLDREQRRELLAGARRLWRQATLLCITHDVGETQAFDRVLVMAGGRIVEDGTPVDLAAQPQSRYRALLEADTAVRQGLWLHRQWRRLWLNHGRLIEDSKEYSSARSEPALVAGIQAGRGPGEARPPECPVTPNVAVPNAATEPGTGQR